MDLAIDEWMEVENKATGFSEESTDWIREMFLKNSFYCHIIKD